jgi:hypothetical protein
LVKVFFCTSLCSSAGGRRDRDRWVLAQGVSELTICIPGSKTVLLLVVMKPNNAWLMKNSLTHHQSQQLQQSEAWAPRPRDLAVSSSPCASLQPEIQVCGTESEPHLLLHILLSLAL